MKSWFLVATVLAALPSANAQTPGLPRGETYVFAAPFARPVFGGRATYVAGGGEVFLYRGASIGAEVGPVISSSEAGGTYVFGLGSANVAYHFSRESKIEAFLSGGYSVTFRAGVANGSHVGAGVNFWQKKNVALRFEFRAYLGRLRIDEVGPCFGVTFR
jgi:opacity protein-like surface antigen